MNSLKKEKLIPKAYSGDGKVLTYAFELKDLQFKERTSIIFDSDKKLRQLLRSEQNLKECEANLHELLTRRNHEDPFIRNDHNGHRARFAFASVLYGACFVRGEDRKNRPLSELEAALENDSTHSRVLTYRHKLFSHLDEDHNVRTDKLIYQMRINENNLHPPITASLSTNHLLLPGDVEIGQWKNLIGKVLAMIFLQKKLLIENINARIGIVTIHE